VVLLLTLQVGGQADRHRHRHSTDIGTDTDKIDTLPKFMVYWCSIASFGCRCHKWSFNDVIDLHKRRYLLMDIAIEIFASDGRNQFVALGKADRNKVHTR
jgi:hypothetical protein